MKEVRKIISLYEQVDFSKRKAALATVIAVEGSSYRRPGAKMLITDDGRWEGSISGGCLEGDALRKARKVMSDGIPMIVTYDTMEDSSGSLGAGLGCNGIIHIFIEPIDPLKNDNPVLLLKKIYSVREETMLTTVVYSENHPNYSPGKRIVVTEGAFEGIQDILEEVENCRLSGRSVVRKVQRDNHQIHLFIEKIIPEIHLLIFGAGYDSVPLVNMAAALGWQVTVTEDCIAHLSPVKFSPSCQLTYSGRDELDSKLIISKNTATVLLSHNYQYDLAVLKVLSKKQIPYIGILGPAKRFFKMKKELEMNGTFFSSELLKRIYAPAGLDIGAETPDEIAVAIIAEIKSVFAGRSAGLLRERTGPIHERTDDCYTPSPHTTCRLR